MKLRHTIPSIIAAVALIAGTSLFIESIKDAPANPHIPVRGHLETVGAPPAKAYDKQAKPTLSRNQKKLHATNAEVKPTHSLCTAYERGLKAIREQIGKPIALDQPQLTTEGLAAVENLMSNIGVVTEESLHHFLATLSPRIPLHQELIDRSFLDTPEAQTHLAEGGLLVIMRLGEHLEGHTGPHGPQEYGYLCQLSYLYSAYSCLHAENAAGAEAYLAAYEMLGGDTAFWKHFLALHSTLIQ